MEILYFDSKFTKIYSQVSNWQWADICLDNGLMPFSEPMMV